MEWNEKKGKREEHMKEEVVELDTGTREWATKAGSLALSSKCTESLKAQER